MGLKDVRNNDYITPWIKGIQDTVNLDASIWKFEKFIELSPEIETNITGSKKDNGALGMFRMALFDAFIAKKVNEAGLAKDLQAIQKEFLNGPLGDAEKKAQHMAKIYSRADVVCTQETGLVLMDLMTKKGIFSKAPYFRATGDHRERQELGNASVLFFRTGQWSTAEVLSSSGVDGVTPKEVSVVLATDANGKNFVVACAHSNGNGGNSETIITKVSELAAQQAEDTPVVFLTDANTNHQENLKKPTSKASVVAYLGQGQSEGYTPIWGTQPELPITADKERAWSQFQLNKANVRSVGRSDWIWTKNLSPDAHNPEREVGGAIVAKNLSEISLISKIAPGPTMQC